MKTVNIHEAKTHLSRLVEEVAEGEEIVVAKAGKPMARLVPYRPQLRARRGGQFAGKISESPACWEPENVLDESIAAPIYTPWAEAAPKVAEDGEP